MNETTIAIVATLILAAIFVNPFPRNVLDERTKGFRRFVSFSAGVSLAYVFIDLLPEFTGVGQELVDGEVIALPFPEYFVYLAALAGFVLFYGLENLVRWSGGRTEAVGEGSGEEGGTPYRIKLAGMAGYAGLVLYLMTAGLREGSTEGLTAYVIAMTFHFVALRHSLRYEYPGPYHRTGQWVLASTCVGGAVLGLAATLPLSVEALLLGFLGGMLIMNTTVMEMPTEKEGRFGTFAAGAALYALLLILR